MARWKHYSVKLRYLTSIGGQRIRCTSYTGIEVNCKPAARHFALEDFRVRACDDRLISVKVELERDDAKKRGGEAARKWHRRVHHRYGERHQGSPHRAEDCARYGCAKGVAR
jgi:hypothetical protein